MLIYLISNSGIAIPDLLKEPGIVRRKSPVTLKRISLTEKIRMILYVQAVRFLNILDVRYSIIQKAEDIYPRGPTAVVVP